MSLLFDQNLSRRLPTILSAEFPGSEQALLSGLAVADDRAVWAYAAARGLAVVSKDADFVRLSAVLGPPPKVVWMRVGNGPTRDVAALLRGRAAAIRVFLADPGSALLELPQRLPLANANRFRPGEAMSHTSIREAPEGIDTPPHEGNGVVVKDGGLTPEAREALLARARDVIHGRVRPPTLEPPAATLAAFHREFAGYNPPPTAEAIRDFSERWALDATYRGESVVAFRIKDGDLAVLGVGDAEISAILRGLEHDDRSDVVVMDTEPPGLIKVW